MLALILSISTLSAVWAEGISAPTVIDIEMGVDESNSNSENGEDIINSPSNEGMNPSNEETVGQAEEDKSSEEDLSNENQTVAQETINDNDEIINGEEFTTGDYVTESGEIIDSSKMAKITEEVAEEFALNWAKTAEPDLNLAVSSIVEMYDVQNNFIGYSVSYCLEDTPYGYVILDFSKPDIIVEYSIFENTPDILEQIIENNEAQIPAEDISVQELEEPLKTDVLYQTEPFIYHSIAEVDNESVVLDNYGNKETLDEFVDSIDETEGVFDEESEITYAQMTTTASTNSSVHNNTAFIDVSKLNTNYNKVSQRNFPEFASESEKNIERLTGHYACAVQALYICNLALGHYNSKVKTEYMNIWNLTDTTISETENGINYGSTPNNKIGSGYIAFLKKYYKKTGITSTYSESPSYSFFTNAVKNRQISVLSYSVVGNTSGHSVAVEGYATYTSKSTGGTLNTLLVADGWKYAMKYINYTASGYRWRRGTKWSGIKVPA